MTKHADLKRRIRARMAKTGESYAAARARLLADGARDLAAALHVTHGDITEGQLRRTGLARAILLWRDVLNEGPVPDVADDELRRIRATFLADAPSRAGDVLATFERRDRTLAAHRDGEYVLWFEADLYDQLQIIQILSQLAAGGVAAERITLICIGEHPGVAHFAGLGELEPEQLPPLLDTAARLEPEALGLATDAWAAFRAPDPAGLGSVARAHSPQLRFLAEAFDRLGREYPSTRDGLSLTERRILAAASERQATAGAIFVALGRRETRPYLGDTWAFAAMERLARARTPLLGPAPSGPVTHGTPLLLTTAGEVCPARRGRPRRPQRNRPLDRRCAPHRRRPSLAMGRGDRDHPGRLLIDSWH